MHTSSIAGHCDDAFWLVGDFAVVKGADANSDLDGGHGCCRAAAPGAATDEADVGSVARGRRRRRCRRRRRTRRDDASIATRSIITPEFMGEATADVNSPLPPSTVWPCLHAASSCQIQLRPSFTAKKPRHRPSIPTLHSFHPPPPPPSSPPRKLRPTNHSKEEQTSPVDTVQMRLIDDEPPRLSCLSLPTSAVSPEPRQKHAEMNRNGKKNESEEWAMLLTNEYIATTAGGCRSEIKHEKNNFRLNSVPSSSSAALHSWHARSGTPQPLHGSGGDFKGYSKFINHLVLCFKTSLHPPTPA